MNLIFDIGNVICEWDPDKLVKQIFSDPVQQREALESIFEHSDWLELDKGTISLEAAISNAVARCSSSPAQIETLFTSTPTSLLPIPTMVETIQELSSRGFSLYILSNMQRHSWEYLTAKHSFWTLFSGIVVSFEVNLIKPDPEIFRYITGKYDLVPADTLFLDDRIDNINAASAFGLNTIHVVDPEDCIAEVSKAIGI